MGRWHTREELYEIVWADPVSKVAPLYGVSAPSLAKTCARARVPLPERGYWAKLRYGKSPRRTPLVPREPGMSDRVYVGRSGSWSPEERENLLREIAPPTFPDDIDELAASTARRVGRPRVPALTRRTHPVIQRVLDEDAQRRHEQTERGTYAHSWRQPRFDAPGDQRRLRAANALFLALDRLDAEPDFRDHGEFELGAVVGNTWVPITIAFASVGRRSARARPLSRIEVSVPVQGIPGRADGIWNESEQPIERQIAEIAAGVVVAGELLHRAREQEWYEFWLETKQRDEEEQQQRQLEAEGRERERIEAEAQARIDRLLAEAAEFRRAADIRAYVGAARTVNERSATPVPRECFESWAVWALAEADRIDPVSSGGFLDDRAG